MILAVVGHDGCQGPLNSGHPAQPKLRRSALLHHRQGRGRGARLCPRGRHQHHSIRKLSGQDKIQAIIGGMHLLNASEARLAFTVDSLQEYEDQILAPAHGTGMRPAMLLLYRYPKRCRPCNVGSQFVFE